MTLPCLLAFCAPQDGDIQTIVTLSYVAEYPYSKSHSVIALYLSHTDYKEKNLSFTLYKQKQTNIVRLNRVAALLVTLYLRTKRMHTCFFTVY